MRPMSRFLNHVTTFMTPTPTLLRMPCRFWREGSRVVRREARLLVMAS